MKKIFITLFGCALFVCANAQNIAESGDWCEGTLVLTLDINSAENIKWTKDGVVLENQNDLTINLTQFGMGEYSAIYTFEGTGMKDNKTVLISGPIANFEYEKYLAAGGIQFTGKSTYSSDVIQSWEWNFGQGKTDLNQNPFVEFPAPGTYSVSLTVTDENGCSNTITRDIMWSYDQ